MDDNKNVKLEGRPKILAYQMYLLKTPTQASFFWGGGTASLWEGKSTIDMCHTQGGNFDAIENLWRGVESIMLAKQGVVEQVLEEYGIGEAENGEEGVSGK
ncbi:hypothetical protein Btru_001773 [Bulinus truncatus]|nr:hypothetical protein Btru_001773 [Bulinus truncatus]